MSLELLNLNGPEQTEATGMTPPLMRAICHVGFAVGLGDRAEDNDWDVVNALIVVEIDEAKRHLGPSGVSSISDGNPYIPASAISAVTLLYDQFSELVGSLPDMDREAVFADLKVLAENCAYIAAMLERFVTGNQADEGRNP